MKKFHGFTIFTDKVNDTTHFYTKLLGIEPIEKTGKSALFDLNGVRFFIHQKAGSTVDGAPDKDHIELSVENVSDMIAQLENNDIKISHPAKKYYWGTSAYVTDPDGRVIEFVEK